MEKEAAEVAEVATDGEDPKEHSMPCSSSRTLSVKALQIFPLCVTLGSMPKVEADGAVVVLMSFR